ncbi:hypothetical protein ACSW8S_15815 (plasmid) [Clostridium perfringens]
MEINNKILLEKARVLKEDYSNLEDKKLDIYNKINEYERQFFNGKTYEEFIDDFKLTQNEINGVKLSYCLGIITGEVDLDKGNKIIVSTHVRASKDVYIKKYVSSSGREYEDIPKKYIGVCEEVITVLCSLKVTNPGEELREMLS